MYFLNSKSLELQQFPTHENVIYAILSHTWTDDEVLFHELEGYNAETTPPKIKQKRGYQKIQASCAQANSDGFEYVWIDTCCIDKRSSTELSEAINSMYLWYSSCAVCYAYLSDVPSEIEGTEREEKFRRSRWFTRGWTLQELIAPFNLEFYSEKWHSKGQEASLGTKRSRQKIISKITGIPSVVLHNGDTTGFSIAQKMYWAAGRNTTKVEDVAYSLMGIFDVNMPLLYGEGLRAFTRLQEEIMKKFTDESLFAWAVNTGLYDSLGLLARSPDDFSRSGSIVEKVRTHRTSSFALTNRGLRLEVILLQPSTILGGSDGLASPFSADMVAVLNCMDEPSGKSVGIILTPSWVLGKEAKFFRSKYHGLVYIDPDIPSLSEASPRSIVAQPTIGNSKLRGFHTSSRFLVLVRIAPNFFPVVDFWPKTSWGKVGNEDCINGLFFASDNLATATLLFDNRVTAFIVAFGFLNLRPWTEVQQWMCGQPLDEAHIPSEYRSPTAKNADRASHKPSPRRIVSASLRPQIAYGRHLHVLYISG